MNLFFKFRDYLPQSTHLFCKSRRNSTGMLTIYLVQHIFIQFFVSMGNFTGFEKSDDFYIHPRLGQIKRIQKQDGPQLIQHKIFVESEDIVSDWIDSTNKLSATSCENILFLPKSYYCQKIGYCGRNCQVFLLFDDFMFCLKDQIKNRRSIQRPFPQSFIWQLLYKLIKTEAIMQKLDLKIGNISTQRDIRIICQYSWPCIQNAIINQNENKILLFSPEEIKSYNTLLQKILRKRESQICETPVTETKMEILNNSYNQNLSQVFSIGMTLLEICCLIDSQSLYHNNGINQIQMMKRLSSLQAHYSMPLICLIFQMLKFDQKNRIKSETIVELLKQHQQSILSHNKFELQRRFQNPFMKITPTLKSTTEKSQKMIQANQVATKSSNKSTNNSSRKWNKIKDFFPLLCMLKVKQTTSVKQMKYA